MTPVDPARIAPIRAGLTGLGRDLRRARTGSVGTTTAVLRQVLPRGRMLPYAVWVSRHHAIVVLLWLHVIGLSVFAVATGHSALHGIAESFLVALAALAASWPRLGRGVRSCAASVGLVTASAVLVHLSGGLIEAHFHFFVVLGILALYQDWAPFLTAIGYLVAHHAIVGVIDPGAVFNHPAAQANPLLWALVHGGFVLAASSVSLVTWRFVERQSLHDPLTDLPNRALFGDRVAHALARASRSGLAVGVLFIDLDDFKSVNDRLGHTAGDQLLRVIADRIRACLRPGDTAGRLGGDEFAALIEDVTEPDRVGSVADRLAAAVRQPIDLEAGRVSISASIGVSTVQGGGRLGEDILREADQAMYEEKRLRSDRRARFGPRDGERTEVAPAQTSAPIPG